MKEKQRNLETESRLSAKIEGGGKRGRQYLFFFAYSSSLFQKHKNSLDPTNYSLTAILSPFCNYS